MRKERKELLTLWIILSLQLGTYAAQGIVSHEVMVDNSQSVPVIQIATPTHGVSHNRYESFSTDTGLSLTMLLRLRLPLRLDLSMQTLIYESQPTLLSTKW